MGEEVTSRLCLGPCGEVLSLGSFAKNCKGTYGRTSRCRACLRAAERAVDREQVRKKAAEKLVQDKLDAELGSKECVVCGERKKFDEYLSKPGGRFGVDSRCRVCKNEAYRDKLARARAKRESAKAAKIRADLDSQSKECTKCGVRKSFSKYYVSKIATYGLSQRCRVCKKEDTALRREENKDKYLQRTYGITRSVYIQMLKSQGGVCAICRGQEVRKARGHVDKVCELSVDHSHITGKVRGLLCNHCNRGIGLLQDDPVISKRAAAYLERGNNLPGPVKPQETLNIPQPEVRTCVGPCGKALSLELFGSRKNQKDGVSRWCRACVSEAERLADKEARARRVAERKAREQSDAKLGSKECTNCGVRKTFSEYSTAKYSSHGRQTQCKACLKGKHCPIKTKDKYLKKVYSISSEEYAKMLELQGEVCAICHEPETTGITYRDRPQSLAVDHNHDTGAVRGLLCTRCNKGIGLLKDDETTVLRASEYLKGVDK